MDYRPKLETLKYLCILKLIPVIKFKISLNQSRMFQIVYNSNVLVHVNVNVIVLVNAIYKHQRIPVLRRA